MSKDTDVYNQRESENMQLVAQGATAGTDGCQTLREISKQMGSLLDRQSSQRILSNESGLLAERQQCHKRVTLPDCNTHAVNTTAELHKHS